MKIPNILIVGDDSQAGTYILGIRFKRDTTLQFGRFKKGKLIFLPAGDYVYVGSALSEKGSTSLARRLIRHVAKTWEDLTLAHRFFIRSAIGENYKYSCYPFF